MDERPADELLSPHSATKRFISYWNEWGNLGKSWLDLRLYLADFKEEALAKFGIEKKCSLEVSFVRQQPGYTLGPHTDSPRKVLTVLIYLPADSSSEEAGTVIYGSDGFRCSGKAHHRFKDFERVKAIPFLPNTVFVFQKSDISFHGVETVKKTRDVIQYNINA